MIRQRTFTPLCDEDELAAIAGALDMLRLKRYEDAAKILAARHDVLVTKPTLKPYDPREVRQ